MKKKVLVGLSGGLDSTVSALLLQQQGYEVIGVHFQLWHDDTADKLQKNLPENKCCSLSDLMLARTVAKKLKIPFFVFDFRDRFYQDVVDDFLKRFALGVTPNPCVECNRSIKFGYFLEKMAELGCDAVATGHFVDSLWNKELNRYEVRRGKDDKKDQTYFLYTLTQKKLAHIIFPMGQMTKEEGREIANKNELEVFAEKRESQGVCFYAEGSHLPFLKRKMPDQFVSGEIRHIDTDKVVGEHDGVLNFTKGQRARVGGLLTPHYVIKTDVQTHTVWIGENKHLYSDHIYLSDLSWTMEDVKSGENVLVRVRHGGELYPATFYQDEKNKYLKLLEPIRAITPGQSAVMYRDDILLGGGIII